MATYSIIILYVVMWLLTFYISTKLWWNPVSNRSRDEIGTGGVFFASTFWFFVWPTVIILAVGDKITLRKNQSNPKIEKIMRKIKKYNDT